MYKTVFPDLNQPETIVKCMNGCYYIGDSQYSSYQGVIDTLLSAKHDCIIKPTVDSCNGVGIAKLKFSDVEELECILASYGNNYIVQKKVEQHIEMARLNASSLNTLRVFTYRTLDGEIHYIEGKTFARYGGTHSVMDNGSAGGGLLKVNDDGSVDDKIVFFKKMSHRSLSEDKGIRDFVIPCFDEIKTLVVKQHERLPHFDFIGWDISIEENGKPIFIEFNIEPSIEAPQMISGPFFGNYFEEVVERLKGAKKVKSNCYRNIFKNGFEYQQIVNK
ncbi:MAG: sugar-transfer associated ATP-grasp domain-containing protein [Prevotella sp.]